MTDGAPTPVGFAASPGCPNFELEPSVNADGAGSGGAGGESKNKHTNMIATYKPKELESDIAAAVKATHGEKSLDQLGMKLAEEVGEVVGAMNKLGDGRSVMADVDAEIGDVLIVLCQLAERRGCTLEDYLMQRWATVLSRERREAAGEMISTPIMEDFRARLAAQQDRIDWLEQQREIAVNDLERRTREVIGEEHIELQGRLESALASQKARGTKLLTRIVEAKVCCALEKEKLQRDMTATLGGNAPEQPAREEAVTRLSQAIHAVEQIEVRLGGGGGVLVGDDNAETRSGANSDNDQAQ